MNDHLEIGTAWLARRMGASELEMLAQLDSKRLSRTAYFIGKQLASVADHERKLIERAALLREARQ